VTWDLILIASSAPYVRAPIAFRCGQLLCRDRKFFIARGDRWNVRLYRFYRREMRTSAENQSAER
jgi:hypothetical protein